MVLRRWTSLHADVGVLVQVQYKDRRDAEDRTDRSANIKRCSACGDRVASQTEWDESRSHVFRSTNVSHVTLLCYHRSLSCCLLGLRQGHTSLWVELQNSLKSKSLHNVNLINKYYNLQSRKRRIREEGGDKKERTGKGGKQRGAGKVRE